MNSQDKIADLISKVSSYEACAKECLIASYIKQHGYPKNGNLVLHQQATEKGFKWWVEVEIAHGGF